MWNLFWKFVPEPPPLGGAKLGDWVGVEAIVSLYCRNSPGEDLLGKTAGSVFKTENLKIEKNKRTSIHLHTKYEKFMDSFHGQNGICT